MTLASRRRLPVPLLIAIAIAVALPCSAQARPGEVADWPAFPEPWSVFELDPPATGKYMFHTNPNHWGPGRVVKQWGPFATPKDCCEGIKGLGAIEIFVPHPSDTVTLRCNTGAGDSGRDVPAAGGFRLPRRTARPGNRFQVALWYDNPAQTAAQGMANFNVEVSYDPAVLRAVAAKRGNGVPGNFLFEGNYKTPGKIQVGMAGNSGLTNRGSFAHLSFEVVGSAGQSSPLGIRVIQVQTAGGQSINASTTDGKIIIPGPGNRGEIVTMMEHPYAPTGALKRLRNDDGTLKGDWDGDGRLTVRDAAAALKMSVGNLPVDLNSDMNSDRQVKSDDSRLIQQEAPGFMGRGG